MEQFDNCKAELILVELSRDTCEEGSDSGCTAAPVQCCTQMVNLRDNLQDLISILQLVSLSQRCHRVRILLSDA